MASSEFIDPAKLDLDDQVVAINRITKVVRVDVVCVSLL